MRKMNNASNTTEGTPPAADDAVEILPNLDDPFYILRIYTMIDGWWYFIMFEDKIYQQWKNDGKKPSKYIIVTSIHGFMKL